MENFDVIYEHEINCIRSFENVLEAIRGKKRIERTKLQEIMNSEEKAYTRAEAEEMHRCAMESRKGQLERHLRNTESLRNELFGLLGITESDSDDDMEAAMNTLDKLYETFFDGQAVAEEGNDSIEENHHSGDHPGITMNRDHFECFDECHHSTKIWSNWDDESISIIESEMRCNYKIYNNIITKKDVKDANYLSIVLKNGYGYTSIDEITGLLMNADTDVEMEEDDHEWSFGGSSKKKPSIKGSNASCLSKEKRLFHVVGLPRSSLWVTVCPNGHYDHGSHVVCPVCLKNGDIVRRIRGCKLSTCFANDTYWEEHRETATRSELENAVCNHERVSSKKYFYSMTPTAHLVMLTNTGLDDCILHSTPSDIMSIIEQCKESSVTCPSCSFNSIYGYSSLGETEITKALYSSYKDLDNPKNHRDSLRNAVDILIGENSVENRLFMNKNMSERDPAIPTDKDLQEASCHVYGVQKTASTRSGRRVIQTRAAKQMTNETNRRVRNRASNAIKKGQSNAVSNDTIRKMIPERPYNSILKDGCSSSNEGVSPVLFSKDELKLSQQNIASLNGFRDKFPLAQKCASLRMLEDMKGRCEVSEGYVFLDALSHLLKEKSVSSCCFDENEFISLIEKSENVREEIKASPSFSTAFDENSTVSFVPPTKGSIEDHFVNYRLRADGIKCYDTSNRVESFYVISLEVVNCNETDRELPHMTCYGLLFPKSGEAGKMIDGFSMIDYYLRVVMVTGRVGVYIKKRVSSEKSVWYHWRWFISSVVCDTVAQEELEGCVGKKNGSFPCLYCDNCQRMRFGLDSYALQHMKAPVPILCWQRLSLIGEPLDFLHPNNMYRCASLIYHLDKNVFDEYMSSKGLSLQPDQVNEIKTLRLLFSVFPKRYLHQYLPIALSPVDWIQYRINKVLSICPDIQVEQLENTEGSASSNQTVNDADEEVSNVNEAAMTRIGEYCSLEDVACLQEKEIRNCMNSLSKNPSLERIVGTIEQPNNYDKVLKLEKNILVPPKYREGVDSMHNVYNVCKLFIEIINNVTPSNDSVDSILDCYVRNALYGSARDSPKDWTLFPDFSDVLHNANVRRRELGRILGNNASFLRDDLLKPSHFKTINDHNDILFLCGFYYYLFQDSMDIPVIFLFKVIFDYLIYFFNFNGDLKELMKNQVNYNVIMGLLQNELGPSALSISAHNSCHSAMSAVLHGDLIVTSCFHSERMYQVIKKNCFSGPSPHITCGRRSLANVVSRSVVYGQQNQKHNQKALSTSNCLSINEVFVSCGDGTVVSIPLEKGILGSIVKMNVYDDIRYYKDSTYARNTFFDVLLEKNIGLDSRVLGQMIRDYGSSCSEQIQSIHVNTSVDLSVFSNVCFGNEKVTVSTRLLDRNGLLDSRRIAITRSFKGELVLLWVIGFVTHVINNVKYGSALCIKIPTISGSSFVRTSLYGFINQQEFLESLKNPVVLPVSLYKHHFDKVAIIPFGNDTSYVVLKLCQRQFKVIRQDNSLQRIMKSHISRH